MSYRIEVGRLALRGLKALPGDIRLQARELLLALAIDPRPERAVELQTEPDVYRIWLAGRWRIAYAVEDDRRRIRVLRIRHREDSAFEVLPPHLQQQAGLYDSAAAAASPAGQVPRSGKRRCAAARPGARPLATASVGLGPGR